MQSVPSASWDRRRQVLLLLSAFVIVCVGAVTVWVVVATSPSNDSTGSNAAIRGTFAIGKPAPTFAHDDLDGEPLDLASYRGRPLIIAFWASWCEPCREEFALLAALQKRMSADEVAIVGVTFQDIDSDSRNFVREHGGNWPNIGDRDGSIAKAYGVRALPVTFFVNADGVVVSKVFGLRSRTQLDRELARIMKPSLIPGARS